MPCHVNLPPWFAASSPPRTYFRFGRYRNPCHPHPLPRASRVSAHQGKVSRLTLAHLRSPMLTHRHSLSLTVTHLSLPDQSPHFLRVHFWPLASAAEMGSHDGVVPGQHRTRRETYSKYNDRTPPFLFPRLIFSFRNLSLTVCGRL
jgi:hypothetical protein